MDIKEIFYLWGYGYTSQKSKHINMIEEYRIKNNKLKFIFLF